MKKALAAASVAAACSTPLLALAQAPAAKAEPEFTISGNLTIASDYRFRGYSQTGFKPAFQGGVDFSHKSGFYAGNWNSNVEQDLYTGASLEMDLYGGYKKELGPVTLDVGYLYYYYPNSGKTGSPKIKNGEVYVGAAAGPVSAKVYYAHTRFFSLAEGTGVDTKGSIYLDVSGSYEVVKSLTVLGHVGWQKVKNGKAAGLREDNVYDFKAGVSYDLSGWALGAALIATSKKEEFVTATGENAGKPTVVLSVSKTF